MKNLFLSCLCMLLFHSPATACDFYQLKKDLTEIISSSQSNTGVALFSKGQELLAIHGDKPYPLMSVFKFHQALAISDFLQKKNLPLDTPVYIRKADLPQNTHSPLRDQHPDGEFFLTIEDLLKFTLRLSDNNACDILHKRILPPAGIDKYIRSLGLNDFQIARTEQEMHENLDNGLDNWTTPAEAARLMDMFINGDFLRDSYKLKLKEIMTGCATGQNRLPKYIDDDTIVIGHKTGTGDRNRAGHIMGLNDAGFFILPDNSSYSLAIFIRDAPGSMAENEELIARLSQKVWQCMTSSQ